MLFLLLLISFGKSLPLDDTTDDAYFSAVAEENGTRVDLNSTFGDLDYSDADSFPEDPVDPRLVAEFLTWAHVQPPVIPLSTWRPLLADEQNVTENALGAITRNCPRGCYRSRSGHCLPAYEELEKRTNQKRGITCSVGSGVTPSLLQMSVAILLLQKISKIELEQAFS